MLTPLHHALFLLFGAHPQPIRLASDSREKLLVDQNSIPDRLPHHYVDVKPVCEFCVDVNCLICKIEVLIESGADANVAVVHQNSLFECSALSFWSRKVQRGYLFDKLDRMVIP